MIKFIGCSFTEGGGLDNIDYYNFITNANFSYNDKRHYSYRLFIKKSLQRFRDKHRFSNIVGNKLNLESINLAISRGSNDYILKILFDEIDNNSNEIYVAIFSMFPRVRWYYEKTRKIYNLNSFDFNWPPYDKEPIMKSLSETYEMYLTNIYNLDVEKEKIKTQVKLLDNYAKSKNSKIYWSSWDDFYELEKITNNCITFDNKFLYKYVDSEKLQIHHHTDYKVNDNHLSVIGNEIIADKIYTVIKKDL